MEYESSANKPKVKERKESLVIVNKSCKPTATRDQTTVELAAQKNSTAV